MRKQSAWSWTAGAMVLSLGLAVVSAAPAPQPKVRQASSQLRQPVGAWDITVQTAQGKAYSWLEIERSGATLVGRFVGTVGSVRPISRVEFSQGTLRFTLPPQYEDRDLQFEGRWEGDRLTGTVTGYDAGVCSWTARRAPSLHRERPPRWGQPRELFNGVSLAGWKPQGGENHWTVKNGVLRNTGGGANLVTTEKFNDFKLHVEFRYPAGANSGLYLRGRYEVQIEDDEGPRPSRYTLGGIYGFFAPCIDTAKKPGEWQTFDITLVGRMVTVALNGETVIDRQTIPGITGGALDCDEGSPGPLMIQGDHGPVEFRKITLTPAL
ncbi:MAG TPA: DUF1080 domain-containing protein [Chthonomonadaceae bacterium]|nr:DUF1080 domain-containing protein [Chthonomonadaceae bacterium]